MPADETFFVAVRTAYARLDRSPFPLSFGAHLACDADQARCDAQPSPRRGRVVISIGMAGAAAPLTTAVLTSVDNCHTGSASGLNRALARTGDLLATALFGSVLAASGAPLLAQFKDAAAAGAAVAFYAGVAAFLLLPALDKTFQTDPRPSPGDHNV